MGLGGGFGIPGFGGGSNESGDSSDSGDSGDSDGSDSVDPAPGTGGPPVFGGGGSSDGGSGGSGGGGGNGGGGSDGDDDNNLGPDDPLGGGGGAGQARESIEDAMDDGADGTDESNRGPAREPDPSQDAEPAGGGAPAGAPDPGGSFEGGTDESGQGQARGEFDPTPDAQTDVSPNLPRGEQPDQFEEAEQALGDGIGGELAQAGSEALSEGRTEQAGDPSGEIFGGEGVVEEQLRGAATGFRSGVVSPAAAAFESAAESEVGRATENVVSTANPLLPTATNIQRARAAARGENPFATTAGSETRGQLAGGTVEGAGGVVNLPQLAVTGIEAGEVAAAAVETSPAVEGGRSTDEFASDVAAGGAVLANRVATSARRNPTRFGGQLIGGAGVTSGAIGTAARLGGPRAAKATSATLQPGEELAGTAVRAGRGAAPDAKLGKFAADESAEFQITKQREAEAEATDVTEDLPDPSEFGSTAEFQREVARARARQELEQQAPTDDPTEMFQTREQFSEAVERRAARDLLDQRAPEGTTAREMFQSTDQLQTEIEKVRQQFRGEGETETAVETETETQTEAETMADAMDGDARAAEANADAQLGRVTGEVTTGLGLRGVDTSATEATAQPPTTTTGTTSATDVLTDVEQQTPVDTKVEQPTDVKTETPTDTKTETRTDTRTETRTDTRTETRTDVRTDSRQRTRIESLFETRSETDDRPPVEQERFEAAGQQDGGAFERRFEFNVADPDEILDGLLD